MPNDYPSTLNPLDQVLWHFTQKELRGFEAICRKYTDPQAFLSFNKIRLGSLAYLLGLSRHPFDAKPSQSEELLKLCKLNAVSIFPEFSLEELDQQMANSLMNLKNIHGFSVIPAKLAEYDQTFKNYQKAMLIMSSFGAVENETSRMYPLQQELSLKILSGVESGSFPNPFYSTPESFSVQTANCSEGTFLSVFMSATEPNWDDFKNFISNFINYKE